MHKLMRSDAEFVGAGSFKGRLYDLGNFPGAVPSDESSDRVRGEIYALSDANRILRALDRYEGRAFRRERATVRTDDGRETRSWIYLYDGPISRGRLISSGDYLSAS
jgi:gamma-glutamylcyclotransferase (GGCT)/AIG2-like uncharacterized protein YtfP